MWPRWQCLCNSARGSLSRFQWTRTRDVPNMLAGVEIHDYVLQEQRQGRSLPRWGPRSCASGPT
eukprot:1476437-Pyramimonas_sp.AAC.1